MFAQLDTKSVYSFMDSVVDLNYLHYACQRAWLSSPWFDGS